MNEYEEEKLNELIESGQISEEELAEILREDERANRLFKEEFYGELSEDSQQTVSFVKTVNDAKTNPWAECRRLEAENARLREGLEGRRAKPMVEKITSETLPVGSRALVKRQNSSSAPLLEITVIEWARVAVKVRHLAGGECWDYDLPLKGVLVEVLPPSPPTEEVQCGCYLSQLRASGKKLDVLVAKSRAKLAEAQLAREDKGDAEC